MANVCTICNVVFTNYFSVYKLILQTEENVYDIGFCFLLENLAEWAFNKGMHLSASQIVLLRPDVLRQFLTEFYGEKVEQFGFIEHLVCQKCYKRYTEIIPTR